MALSAALSKSACGGFQLGGTSEPLFPAVALPADLESGIGLAPRLVIEGTWSGGMGVNALGLGAVWPGCALNAAVAALKLYLDRSCC